MAVKITRNQSSHDIFGQPSEFPPSILPTNGDVCRKVWKLKVDTGYKGIVNQFRFTETNKVVERSCRLYSSQVGDVTWTEADPGFEKREGLFLQSFRRYF